jgi:hypothetical protein
MLAICNLIKMLHSTIHKCPLFLIEIGETRCSSYYQLKPNRRQVCLVDREIIGTLCFTTQVFSGYAVKSSNNRDDALNT